MEKETCSKNLATFTSPFTPIFHDKNVEHQKGWSSERVPLPVNSCRRTVSGGGGAMMGFNSGRALPSKWEDAERWITSPVYGYGGTGICKIPNYQVHRRAKSKSGPIGSVNYANYSPATPILDGGGNVRGFTMPVSSLSDESSSPSSQAKDEKKLDDTKDEQNVKPETISRRDMATQMSPESSVNSSLKGWSSSPSAMPVVETNSSNSTKMETKDVQVDKWVTVLRQWSKRYGGRMSRKDPPNVDDLFKTSAVADDQAWPWDVADAAKKFQREEVKIKAWENLQKAKAEAAIKELEMKLERKRSLAMDKIHKKLRNAEMKAHEMRISVPDKLALGPGAGKTKNVQIMGSFRSFFSCHG